MDDTSFGENHLNITYSTTVGIRRILTLCRDDDEEICLDYFTWLKGHMKQLLSRIPEAATQAESHPLYLIAMLCFHSESTVVRTPQQLLARRGVVQSLLASIACSAEVCEIFVEGRARIFKGVEPNYSHMLRLLADQQVNCSSQEIAELLNGKKADLLEPFVKIYLCSQKKRAIASSLDFFRRAEKIAESQKFLITYYGQDLKVWRDAQATESFNKEIGYRRADTKGKKTRNKSEPKSSQEGESKVPSTEGLNLPLAGSKGSANSLSTTRDNPANTGLGSPSLGTALSAQQIRDLLTAAQAAEGGFDAGLFEQSLIHLLTPKAPLFNGLPNSPENRPKAAGSGGAAIPRGPKPKEKAPVESKERSIDLDKDLDAFTPEQEKVLRKLAKERDGQKVFYFNRDLDGHSLTPHPNGEYKASNMNDGSIMVRLNYQVDAT